MLRTIESVALLMSVLAFVAAGASLYTTETTARQGQTLQSLLRLLLMTAIVFLLITVGTWVIGKVFDARAAIVQPQPTSPSGFGSSTCVVKGFGEAAHSIQRLADLDQTPSNCLNGLIQKLADTGNALVVLVGHVDKRELRMPRLLYYGNLASLGYQRALTVRDALLDEYESTFPQARDRRRLLAERMIPVSTGAAHVGLSVSETQLRDDRSVEIHAYSIVAASTTAPQGRSPAPRTSSFLASLGNGDKLTLLTLVVALSAYLASIRLVAIGRLAELKDQLRRDISGRVPSHAAQDKVRRQRAEIKMGLRRLTFADAPMIASGLLLGLHIFYAWSQRALEWSVYLFTVGGLALVASHAGAWWKSVTAR